MGEEEEEEEIDGKSFIRSSLKVLPYYTSLLIEIKEKSIKMNK